MSIFSFLFRNHRADDAEPNAAAVEAIETAETPEGAPQADNAPGATALEQTQRTEDDPMQAFAAAAAAHENMPATCDDQESEPEAEPAPHVFMTPRPTFEPAAAPAFKLLVGGASKRGTRVENEDAFCVGRTRDVFCVSDGIGGAPKGECCSAAACTATVDAAQSGADLATAFQEGNRAVIQLCHWLGIPDSGATLIAAEHAVEPRGHVMRFAWAGDSVAFLLRNGSCTCVTPPDRAAENSNALGSAVGYDPELAPLCAEIAIHPGDRLAICTDGVWSPLGAEKLGALLGAEGENAPWIAESIARTAVEAAGTHADNATVLVLIAQPERVDDPAEGTGSDADAPADVPSTPPTPSFPRLMLDIDPL